MKIEIDVEQFARDIEVPLEGRRPVKVSVHRQFRSLTKTKGGFPNDNSLLELLFMGIQNASKKWTIPVINWSLTISQLAIHFEGRLDKALNL